ncbi:MAG: hypothetical protein U9O53_01950, partial [archaeon]|nr:hypothetical protein [archaeon]
ETPFFIKRRSFPLYIKTISDISIVSENKNVVADGSIRSIDAQELYILVKNKEEPSKLVDIRDTLSTDMPDEFASGQYGEALEFCGYVVDNKFFGKLSDSFYQPHIKDSGFLLKAEIGKHESLGQIYSELDRIVTETEKTIARFKNIGLTAAPAYCDGRTLYRMSET